MLAHETATHAARLRVELSQSRTEQKDYLKNVELARVLVKREERKRSSQDNGNEGPATKHVVGVESKTAVKERATTIQNVGNSENKRRRVERRSNTEDNAAINDVLSQVF